MFLKYKDFSKGTWQRKKYDFHNLSFKEYLKEYYATFNNKIPEGKLTPHRWFQIQKQLNEVYETEKTDTEIQEHLKSIGWAIPFGKASCLRLKLIDYRKQKLGFDEDILRFFAMLECSGFLKNHKIESISSWINRKDWKIEETIYKISIKDIKSYKYGQNLLRSELVELAWLKLF